MRDGVLSLMVEQYDVWKEMEAKRSSALCVVVQQ